MARDLGWLERRLEVDAQHTPSRTLSAYAWCSSSLQAGEAEQAQRLLEALTVLWAAPSPRDGQPLLEAARDQFWSQAVFALRDISTGSQRKMSFYQPQPARRALLDGPSRSWPEVGAIDLAVAFQEACPAGVELPQDGVFDLAIAERLLVLLIEEYPQYERHGLCGPRLGRVSPAWSTACTERFLKAMIAQLGQAHPHGLLDRLRAIDYLQANLEWVRQIALGRDLDAGREALLDLLDLDPDERASASRSLVALADLLRLLPRPAALLAYLCYQLEVAAASDPVAPLTPAAWGLLAKRAGEVLPEASARELSWWCQHGQTCASPLKEMSRLLAESSSDHPTLEWRQLLTNLLALRLLSGASMDGIGALRWQVAEQFSGLSEGAEARAEGLRALANAIRDRFIDLDLRPLLAEFDRLEAGWRLQAGW
jgi:hypothetical protein